MRAFDLNKNQTLAAICDSAEVSHNGVLWLQSDGQILAANEILLNQLGYEKDDVLPTTIFEVNPTMSFLSWKKFWKQLVTNRKKSFKSELLTANESIFPVKLNCIIIQADGKEVMMLSAQNLMETQRYKDLYKLTSRIAGIGSWEWDLVNDEFIFNDEMYALLEMSPQTKLTQDLLTDYIIKGLSEGDWKVFTQNIEAAIVKGVSFEFDYSFEVNGVFKNFNLNAKPVVFEEQTIKIYGTLQNVANISKRTDDMFFTKYCMDYALDMIYWVSQQGEILYVNQTVCSTMGYKVDELLGKKIQFIDREFDKSNDSFWEELKSKKSIEFESWNITKSGEKIPVSVVTNYINFRGKEFNCAFVRNFSSKIKKDELLSLSKSTLDDSPNPIFWAKEDGTFKYFNEAFLKKFEYTAGEIKQMKVLDFIYEGDESQYKKEWEKLKIDKHYQDVFRSMITKSGRVFPTEMTISMTKMNKKNYSITTVKDITERERLEKLAQLSKHSLDKSLDMIFWLNEDASFRYFNHAFVQKTGYTKEQIHQMKVLDFFPESNFEDFSESWKKLKQGTKFLEMGQSLKLKNGELILCEANVSMVQFNKEEFSVTVLRNITERKRKEVEINNQFEEITRLQEMTAAENIELKEEIELEFNFNNIITRDPSYKRVLRQVEQVADTDATVLLLGETGTGKELLARAIHQLSTRSDSPMVKVNCGALPANLIESEFFGHEKGSFTGAYQRKIGKFERANKGTIFLDEMGELPLDMQAKLLRVLQEGEIERVGGNELILTDVRIIAATNRNLEEAVKKGKFREDLFYRLNVFPIYNIPLRERREDIPILIKHFTEKYAKKINKEISEISPTSMNKLMRYDFLGNVRELENLVERAVILSKGKVLNFDLSLSSKSNTQTSSKFLTMEEMQKQHILDALLRAKGKVSGDLGAAQLLGMNDKTLTSRMKKLGMKKGDFLN